MTEDDTFLRLKGLSYEECVEMYTLHYLAYFKSNPGHDLHRFGLHVDKILKPYGWSCQSMEKYGLDNNLV